MEERIVITQDWLVKDMKVGMPELDKLFICQKIEQVPETFDELKILCEGIKGVEVYTGYISCHKLLFWDNGEISSETDDGEEIVYIENRTPAQMWNIIKNLIGEK